MTDSLRPVGRVVRAISISILSLVLVATALTLAPATAGAAPGDPADGAGVAQAPADALVFHVDAAAPLVASTDGSAQHPLPSLAWGMIFADHHRKAGKAVRLVVAPGVYRETLTVGWAGDAPQPLVIESAVPGAAVVTGADVVTDVTDLGSGRASVPWSHDWGLSPVPGGWSSVNVPEGIRRREAVFVDGAPLVQVLTEAALVPGSFFVDQAGDRIVIANPAGVADLRNRVVEVSVRQRALQIQGLARSVVVRGMVFQAGAAPLDRHMAYVSDSTDVLLENNTFRHSSWGGLGVCCTSGITVRNNRIVDNGGNGLDTYKTTDALIEGNTVTGNNVLGGRHGYVGWSVAGSKNLLLRKAVFRNNTFDRNHTRGLWLDTDVADVVLDRVTSCNNRTDGLFIEATQGPVTIENSTFCDNGKAGILTGTSSNVTIRRTTLEGNPYGQLVFSGERQRSWVDHLTGVLIQVPDFADWTLVENTFRSDGSAPLIYSPVIPLTDWRSLLGAKDITASKNTWTHPNVDQAIKIQNSYFPMAEWATLTGDTAPAAPVVEAPAPTAPVVEAPPQKSPQDLYRERIDRFLKRWLSRMGWSSLRS